MPKFKRPMSKPKRSQDSAMPKPKRSQDSGSQETAEETVGGLRGTVWGFVRWLRHAVFGHPVRDLVGHTPSFLKCQGCGGLWNPASGREHTRLLQRAEALRDQDRGSLNARDEG